MLIRLGIKPLGIQNDLFFKEKNWDELRKLNWLYYKSSGLKYCININCLLNKHTVYNIQILYIDFYKHVYDKEIFTT